MRSKRELIVIICVLAVFSVSFPMEVNAADNHRFTIVHTNDLHSHLMSYFPAMDFTYETNDDKTKGGIARIATVISNIRKERNNPVLVVDAGDFMMGTMYHTLAPEKAYEIKLMKKIGYDIISFGNHEFDLGPKVLGKILRIAEKSELLPRVVCSNMIFSRVNPGDDELENAFDDGLIKKYHIKNINGFKIGFFSVLGKDAAFKARNSQPVEFSDPVKTAVRIVKTLREKERVNFVVCLSHSGIKKRNSGEDVKLAEKVDGIDLIVSGHSHTPLKKPIKINDTIIVQAGYYGSGVGVLDIEKTGGSFKSSYSYVDIDDSIQSDLNVLREISDYRDEIDKVFFEPQGYKSRDIIAETEFDLLKKADDSGLGNLLSDSVLWYANKYSYNKDRPSSKVMVSIVAHGMVRESIIKGVTGKISVGELFKILPMGIGKDGSMGYPLVSFYIYPHELKKGLEIVTSLKPIMGDSLYLHLSGVKFSYNPNRMIFDKVSEISIGNEINGYTRINYSKSSKKLIRVAANIYVASFLKAVGRRTWDILSIVPKDASGIPVRDLREMRIDSDKKEKGVQELKEWKAPLEFISSFKDSDGNGIPEIPKDYNKKRGLITVNKSVNPFDLIKNGTIITWMGFLLVLAIFFLMVFIAGTLLNRLYPDRFSKSKGKI